MGIEIRSFLEATISILAIVNPVGNLPLLAALTEGVAAAERRRVFRLAGLTGFCILCVAAVAGKFLMRDVFHIEPPEFIFGGGLLLIVISIRNIMTRLPQRYAGTPSAAGTTQPSEDEEITLAVTPIAFPLLVGPGAIITVMLIVDRHGVLYGLAAGATAFVCVMALLNWSHALLRLMGRVGTIAIGRVLQIFILAIGVHFLFEAIRLAFPGLGLAK